MILSKITRRNPNRASNRAPKRGFATSIMPNPWQDSTQAEAAWGRSRRASRRWAIAGALVGALTGLLAFAPAQWLASAVASFTDRRVLLTDASGTVWSGSAVLVLTGGPDSRDASALPGRINWSLGVQGLGLLLKAQHACCLNGTTALQIKPGWGRVAVTLLPPTGGHVGQWPSALLNGLGTPWNTLQLGGSLRLMSQGFTIETVQGRTTFNGNADIELTQASSRLSTLESMGSYRVSITGNATRPTEPPQLSLLTTEGALKLSGTGTLTPKGVRFRGEATAAPADLPALSNLLNIIGRRDGARSVISIG
jgi:general secretion pathway protein N